MNQGPKRSSKGQARGARQKVQPITPTKEHERSLKSVEDADQEWVQRLTDYDCSEDPLN